MKYSTSIKKVLLNILLLLLCIPLSAGDPVEPTEAERVAFMNKLERFISHQELQQQSFSDVVASLSNTIVKTIECPEGSEVMQVVINIKTNQIRWDKNLTINGRSAGIGYNNTGWYHWTYEGKIEDGVKTIDACNYILLDSMLMVDQEASPPFGPAYDEALLFHELLHGQLVIDSIMTNPAYQQKLCNCTFDLSAADISHELIPGKEVIYLEALLRDLGEEDPTVYVASPSSTAANVNGKFRIPVAPISILDGKDNPRIEGFYPKGHNMVRDSLNLDFGDDSIYVTGCLQDPSKQGLLVFIIDPPGVFIFGGIAFAFDVQPAPPRIPVLHTWGILILLLIMAIAAVVALKGYPDQWTLERRNYFWLL
jgi:hypothetical protein